MIFLLRLPKGIGLHWESPEMGNTDEECVRVCMYKYVLPENTHTPVYYKHITLFLRVISEGQIILFLSLLKNTPFFSQGSRVRCQFGTVHGT